MYEDIEESRSEALESLSLRRPPVSLGFLSSLVPPLGRNRADCAHFIALLVPTDEPSNASSDRVEAWSELCDYPLSPPPPSLNSVLGRVLSAEMFQL